MDLIHRWQEITKSQCELIQEKKSIDHKLDCRIATKCRLEQQKVDILPHVKVPSAHVVSVNVPKQKTVPNHTRVSSEKLPRGLHNNKIAQLKLSKLTILMTVCQIESY